MEHPCVIVGVEGLKNKVGAFCVHFKYFFAMFEGSYYDSLYAVSITMKTFIPVARERV